MARCHVVFPKKEVFIFTVLEVLFEESSRKLPNTEDFLWLELCPEYSSLHLSSRARAAEVEVGTWLRKNSMRIINT